MRCILTASDLSPRSDRALARAGQLAATHGARLVLVHVIDDALPDEIAAPLQAQAEDRLRRLWASIAPERAPLPDFRIETGDVSADLHDIAADEDADLVVLGLHRVRPLLDLFRETTLERLVRLGTRPKLVVRDPADKPYARVLVAVDFSPASARAAALAQTLAPDAALRGFHAVHIPYHGTSDPQGRSADAPFYLRAARAELDDWAAGQDAVALAGATEVCEGSVHGVLDQAIRDWAPDLVALGAHGRTGRAPFLLGSFANDLMRNPPCDLLIARP